LLEGCNEYAVRPACEQMGVIGLAQVERELAQIVADALPLTLY
jgi:hypothetical protein